MLCEQSGVLTRRREDQPNSGKPELTKFFFAAARVGASYSGYKEICFYDLKFYLQFIH